MRNKLFTLVIAWLFTLAMLTPSVVTQAQTFDFKTKTAVVTDFNTWTGYSSTTVAAGSATITIENPNLTVPGQGVINPFQANSTLLVDIGTVQETVTITSASCTDPAKCTITATFASAHSGRYPLKSGTSGLQEAVDSITNAGGKGTVIVPPTFVGTTANITAVARGSATITVEDRRNGGPVYYGWNGTAYAAGPNISAVQIATVASDFLTDGASTSLQNITGLSYKFPANIATSVPFGCTIIFAQGTGTALVTFGVQDVTVAPTNGIAVGFINLSSGGASAVTGLPTASFATTSATGVISGTPTAASATNNLLATLSGYIEHPSNASSSVFNIMVQTATAADRVIVRRGSACKFGL